MSDRINYLTVTLTDDFREEEITLLVSMIEQFRGVASVGINVANPGDYAARQRVKWELSGAVMRACEEIFSGRLP